MTRMRQIRWQPLGLRKRRVLQLLRTKSLEDSISTAYGDGHAVSGSWQAFFKEYDTLFPPTDHVPAIEETGVLGLLARHTFGRLVQLMAMIDGFRNHHRTIPIFPTFL
jgi:hypothetical protein